MATTPAELPAVKSPTLRPERSVARAARIALLLALADLLLGGMISIWMALGAVLYYVPKTIASAVKKDWSVARLRLAKGVVVFAIAASSLELHAWDRRGALERSHALVAAIEHYKADTGKFPARLEDLVPTYLASVPRARWFFGSGFVLRSDRPGGPTLVWSDLPPFGSRGYDFKAHQFYLNH